MSLRIAKIFSASLLILGGVAAAVSARQQTQQPPPSTPPQSLGDAARKIRQESKNEPKAAKTFTNDDAEAIKSGGVSTVGAAPAAPTAPAAGAQAKPATAPEPAKGEEYWKKRFAEARQKLALAQKELDIMQRELNLNQMQYYSDPNKALQQQYSREDINDKTAKIEAKKQEIAQLQQAIVDLTDELHRSGGEPGWAN